MPPSGKCPIDHRVLADPKAGHAVAQKEVSSGSEIVGNKLSSEASHTPEDAKGRIGAQPTTSSKCPVDHTALSGRAHSKCPVDHQAPHQGAGMNGSAQDAMAEQKPVCPFGFTSEASSMTSLHCPKCRSLFFDCVKTDCGHSFCRSCIEASSECLNCGATISELQPDRETQSLVDTFIQTHSGDETFLEGKPIMSKADSEQKDAEATRATFLLELGLRSFAGGNFVAASSRLAECRGDLLKIVEERGSSPELGVQLGAVCGSQGDCSLQLRDSEAALRHYEASIQFLEECSSPTSEVQQALTITQNKLGDLWYRIGNLDSARGYYKRALAIRKSQVQSAAESEKERAELDLALSFAKLADISSALEDKETHKQSLDEAKRLAAHLHSASLENPHRKRADALHAYLAAA